MKPATTLLRAAVAAALVATPFLAASVTAPAHADDEAPRDRVTRDRSTRAPGRNEADPPEMVAKAIDLYVRAAWKDTAG